MDHLEAKQLPSSSEQELIKSINAYINAKAEISEKERLVYHAKLSPAPKYVTGTNVLIAIIIMIVFGAMFG
jgi:hypothetical protein